jgi:hypothetical protein
VLGCRTAQHWPQLAKRKKVDGELGDTWTQDASMSRLVSLSNAKLIGAAFVVALKNGEPTNSTR